MSKLTQKELRVLQHQVQTDANARFLMFSAIEDRNLELAKVLIKFGLPIKKWGGSLLAKVVESANPDFLKLFLEEGIHPNASQSKALHLAIEDDKEELLEIFLKHAANFHSALERFSSSKIQSSQCLKFFSNATGSPLRLRPKELPKYYEHKICREMILQDGVPSRKELRELYALEESNAVDKVKSGLRL